MNGLYDAGAAALAVFLVLGAVDGIYLHLWRYRLHARRASRVEHRWHTATAVLFAATLPAVFLWETGGALLWAGIGLIAVDAVVSVADMVSEGDSRADFGGLSTGEYVLHMVIMSVRGAGLALLLAGRPATAWALDAPWVLGSMPPLAATVAWQALAGATLMAALHVWLCTDSGVRTFESLRTRAVMAVQAWRGLRPDGCC